MKAIKASKIKTPADFPNEGLEVLCRRMYQIRAQRTKDGRHRMVSIRPDKSVRYILEDRIQC